MMDTFENKKNYSEKNHVVFICPKCRKTIKAVINAGFESEEPVKPLYYNDNKFIPLVECPFCEKTGYFNAIAIPISDMIICDPEMVDIINALLDKGYSYINDSFNGGYMKTLIKGSSFFTDDNKDPYFNNLTVIRYPMVDINLEKSISILFNYYYTNYKNLNKEEVKIIFKLLNEIYPDRLNNSDKNNLINEVDNITEENNLIFGIEIIEFIYTIFREINKLDYCTKYEKFDINNGYPYFINNDDYNNIIMSLYSYNEEISDMKLVIESIEETVTEVEETNKKKVSYVEARENLLNFIKNKLPNLYSLTDMIELYNRVKLYKTTHKKEE